MRKILTPWLIIISLLLVVSQSAFALKSDRDQPADIEADDIEFDFKKGTRTYKQNVLVVQGTLRLKADKLFALYQKNGELDTATAWGSLARFKQRPDGKEHDVEGWAKKIIVDEKANTLTLEGKASLKQGANTARGNVIIYNMANDTLKVRGNANIGDGGKEGAKRPAKKIKDPFADDNQGPKSSESSSTPNTDTPTSTVAPTPSGRSRLIIQPRKVEKKPNKKGNSKKSKSDESDKTDKKEN